MDSTKKAKLDLAKKILPPPLYLTLKHVFSMSVENCVLVGGTALSGFYAGHRRSDDLDFFVKDELAYNLTWRAIQSLNTINVVFLNEFRSPFFSKATCCLLDHQFTIDVAIDKNLFCIGTFETLENQITVASLDTLLATKAATLVSRCSEKDLFDLLWLFENMNNLTYSSLIEEGKKIDGGVTAESILMSVSQTILKEEACNFGISRHLTSKVIFQSLEAFQKKFVYELSQYLHKHKDTPLKTLVRELRKSIKAKKVKNYSQSRVR